MKKLVRYKKEMLVGILLFFVGIAIAPTNGIDTTDYNNLNKENEINLKVLNEKEAEINSLKPEIEQIKSEVANLTKELESKKQVITN